MQARSMTYVLRAQVCTHLRLTTELVVLKFYKPANLPPIAVIVERKTSWRTLRFSSIILPQWETMKKPLNTKQIVIYCIGGCCC